jgi:hypothetical protein
LPLSRVRKLTYQHPRFHGRTSDYPSFETETDPFTFVNIGMFGRLAGGGQPGRVYSVATTIDVDSSSTPSSPTVKTVYEHSGQDAALAVLQPCSLIALPDAFPFVTCDAGYTLDSLLALTPR